MKTAVIGVGNIIFQDEGVGVYAATYLEKNYTFSGDVTLVDGGVLGFNLINYYQEYEKILILDTITMEDEIGSVYNLPSEELLGLGSYKQTVHEIEVIEMLEICSLQEMRAEVNIIGIIAKDIVSVNIGLSDEIRAKFNEFIEAALKELASSGVKWSKNKTEFSLEKVIQSYRNPQNV
ncbi:MAG: HyaD/HybD family hydrogenase maturation endopeptidase [Sulfurimonas sp.]|jgi:hydrogenase maturation protease